MFNKIVITGAAGFVGSHVYDHFREVFPKSEIIILDKLFDESNKEQDYKKRRQLQFSKKKISEIFKLSSEQADLIIENLYRLNLCQAPAGHGVVVGEYKFALRTTEVFEFTTFGYHFVQSCKWNK